MDLVLQDNLLSAFLQEELKQRDWTALQLSKETGVTQATISKIMNQQTLIPSVVTLAMLAKTLNRPITDLISACGVPTNC